MTGPDEEAVAGRGRMRAAHADRDRVIEMLKAAFVQGRLGKNEFDARVDQALASRTYADLAALTADIPVIPAIPAAPGPHRTPAGTLTKATRRSSLCMLVGIPLWLAGAGANYFPVILLAFIFVMAASGFFGYGVVDAWQERHPRRQPPPRAGRGRRELDARRPAATHPDPARPDPASPDGHAGRTRAEMRTRGSGQCRRHPSRPGVRVPHGIGPVPGAAYGAP